MTRRLLFVVNVDWFFLSHRLPLALAARDAGFEVHVATRLTGAASAIEGHGLVLHPLALDRRGQSPIDALRLLFALLSLLRRLRPQVVHLVTIKPVLIGGLAARLCRVPRVVAAISGLGFVFTSRGWLARMRRGAVSLLYRLALGHPAVRVIFQNGDDLAMLQRHIRLRAGQAVLVRGSGIDLVVWPALPLPAGPPLVVMASRLLVDKGVREFAGAARLLAGRAGARFVLVGDVDDGNPASLQRDEVMRWQSEGILQWWGHRKDMQAVLAQAHIVVLPSYREGLPRVLIEAAACGRAVVTTDAPGCRDAIRPGVTGLLAAPGDTRSLAACIEELLTDPVRRDRMGRAARQWSEEVFDLRDVVRAHLSLYTEGGAP